MKRLFAVCMTVILLLSLCACGSAAPAETGSIETEAATVAATEPVTEPAETEPAYSGVPLLTVSMINLPLVGDSEDIYIGTSPRELIDWQSDDTSVVTFENGVLTATGVGTANVRAVYQDQVLECTVNCLAETPQELKKVPKAILHGPRRLPPKPDDSVCTFFDDAAFVGDSISYTLEHRSPTTGVIGNPTYLVRGGVSLYGFIVGSKKVTLRGIETDLEVAIQKTGVKKVFMMMGQNDLSYRSIENTMITWGDVLGRIRDKNPDVEIYIQSLVPEWHDYHLSNAKNEKIAQYNEELKVFAAENNCHYVEVAAYFQDSTNQMPDNYTADHGIHINFKGADAWMEVLRAYVKQLEAQGEI